MLDTAQRGSGAAEGGARSRDRQAPTVSCRDRRVPVGVGICTLALLFAVGGNDPATDTDGDGLLDDIDSNGVFSIFDVQSLFLRLAG